MTIKLMGESDINLSTAYPKDVKRGVQYTCATSGLLTQIQIEALGNANVKVAVYADDTNLPKALLAVSAGTAVTTGNPVYIDLTTPINVTSGTKYWIFFVSSVACVAYQDIGATLNTRFYSSAYADAFPDPMGSISDDTADNSFQLAGFGTTGGRMFQCIIV